MTPTDTPPPRAFLRAVICPHTAIFLQVKLNAVRLDPCRLSCIVFPGGEKISLCSLPQRHVPSEPVLLFQSSPRIFDPFHEGKVVSWCQALHSSAGFVFLEATAASLSVGWHTFRGISPENKTHRKSLKLVTNSIYIWLGRLCVLTIFVGFYILQISYKQTCHY